MSGELVPRDLRARLTTGAEGCAASAPDWRIASSRYGAKEPVDGPGSSGEEPQAALCAPVASRPKCNPRIVRTLYG